MTANFTVRIGFVPSMRFPFSHEWCSRMRERTLSFLSQIGGVEVVAPGDDLTPYGLVQNDDDAAKVITYFRDADLDGIIIGAMDFGDEVSAATVAAAIAKPTLLFGTKEGPARPDGERVSDSFCGTLSISAALHRRGVPFSFAGIVFPEEEKFHREVLTFAGASAASKAFLGARVGQIGVRPERFETVAYDEVALLKRFGQKVVPIELSEIVRLSREIAEDDPLAARTAEWIAAEASELNVNDRFLAKAARFELALADFCRAKRLSALAVHCWPALVSQLGIAACSTLGRLTEKGLLSACEADVLGALDMLTQYSAAMHETVPHFIDWTIQHREKPNRFLAWHCGNGPTSLRAKGAKVLLRNRRRDLNAPIPEEDTGAGVWEFPIKHGPVTLSRLAEYDGQFKMLITTGEIVADEDPQRGSWAWVEVPDLDNLYATLVREGFVHHASMIHGDRKAVLRQFCDFVGIKPVVV